MLQDKRDISHVQRTAARHYTDAYMSQLLDEVSLFFGTFELSPHGEGILFRHIAVPGDGSRGFGTAAIFARTLVA